MEIQMLRKTTKYECDLDVSPTVRNFSIAPLLLIPFIENATLLYHEATFMHDRVEAARLKFHTTAKEAALIALKSNAKKLVIGHFSARYEDNLPLLTEVREYFPNTIAAEDGLKIEVRFE